MRASNPHLKSRFTKFAGRKARGGIHVPMPSIARLTLMMNQLEVFGQIRSLIFDVDGVFTDNTVQAQPDGELLRTFNIRDGLAVKLGVRAGLRFFAITGGQSQGVEKRLKGLGFEDVQQGIQDKLAAFESLVETHSLDEAQILYMGDDLPDYPVMRRVGLPACPRDACREVLSISQYVSPHPGGHGCVREIVERLLRIQGKWPLMGEPEESR